MEDDYPASWQVARTASMAAIFFITSFVCFFFLYALLRDQKIRKSSYNVYIIFLILPDAIVNSISHGLFHMFLALNGGENWFPPGYFYVDVWSWIFYYYSNCFLNGIVAFEISRLLHRSYARKRTEPPTLSKAYMQVTVAYFLSALMSLLFVLPVPFALYTITDSRRGSSTLGGDIFDEMTAMAIGFGIMLLPMFYVILVRIQIFRKRLLPKSGRTRALSLFFMRIVIVYFIFYLPNTILTAFLETIPGGPKMHFWVSTALGLSTSAQALVNVYMIYFKDDIRAAVNETWNLTFGRCCCACKGEAERRQITNSSLGGSSRILVSGLLRPPGNESGASRSKADSLPAKKSVWDEPDVYDSDVEEKEEIISHPMQAENPSSHQVPPSNEVAPKPAMDDLESPRHTRVDMAGTKT